MSNRYLTCLSVVFLLHLCLAMVWGIHFIQERQLPTSLNLGPTAMRLKLATKVLLSDPRPVKKIAIPVPKPKKVHATSVPAPVYHEAQSTSFSQVAREDIKSLYKAELRAEIEKHKSYPAMSRRLGQTGTVVVAFTLLGDGHIIDVRLDSPSRFERLNESALEAVKRVHKFRPIPREWGEERMDITVPVKFVTI